MAIDWNLVLVPGLLDLPTKLPDLEHLQTVYRRAPGFSRPATHLEAAPCRSPSLQLQLRRRTRVLSVVVGEGAS